MDSQRSGPEKNYLNEEGKKIDIDEIIKRNEIINNSLNLKYKTMSSYCLKCKTNTENINPRVSKTSNGKTMLLLKCAICGSKKSRFIRRRFIRRFIKKKFLLAGNKFMPEMHLNQPGFTYSVCGPFTKNKERIQKFKETGDTRYIYKNELDKACF